MRGTEGWGGVAQDELNVQVNVPSPLFVSKLCEKSGRGGGAVFNECTVQEVLLARVCLSSPVQRKKMYNIKTLNNRINKT